MLMSRSVFVAALVGLVILTNAANALPVANADATAVTDAVDHSPRTLIDGDAEEVAAAKTDTSPDLRIDETQLAEIAVHSQAEDASSSSSSSSSGFKLSLLPSPPKTAESVNLEHEGIPSKILSSYDNSQKKLADLSNPVPILDTISEHEKYGNNGDMFDGLARTIVNGYEAFSNILNTLIQKPKDLARSISKGITAQLDIIGGKIVGL